jgi:hypothetical protein
MIGKDKSFDAQRTLADVRSDDRRVSALHLFVEPASMGGLEHEWLDAVPVRPCCYDDSFDLDAIGRDNQARQAAHGADGQKNAEWNEQQTTRGKECLGIRHRAAGKPMQNFAQRQQSQQAKNHRERTEAPLLG